MNSLSPFYSLLPLAAALLTSWLLVKAYGMPAASGRFVAIDGLRGFLAFFVFLHHSMAMYIFLRTGNLSAPATHLYDHFGRTSVSLFFMITSFLFYSKLIEGESSPINWMKLYRSRILRLCPLYFFFIFVTALIVAVLLNFQIHESASSIFVKIFQWLSFTIFGRPNIVGVDSDWIVIMAGSTWTLPYEWFFYLFLPVLALTVRPTPVKAIIFTCCFSFAVYILWGPNFVLINIFAFLGGIIAAHIFRIEVLRSRLISKTASFIALASITAMVIVFPTAGYFAHIFLFLTFTIIACGNTLFGALSNPTVRMLGQISYSIYLLHGLVLFVVFKFILGFQKAALLTATEHWLIISACAALLIILSTFTFYFVEAPGMKLSSHMNRRNSKSFSGGTA